MCSTSQRSTAIARRCDSSRFFFSAPPSSTEASRSEADRWGVGFSIVQKGLGALVVPIPKKGEGANGYVTVPVDREPHDLRVLDHHARHLPEQAEALVFDDVFAGLELHLLQDDDLLALDAHR